MMKSTLQIAAAQLLLGPGKRNEIWLPTDADPFDYLYFTLLPEKNNAAM